ncbi:MAG: FixH family protein [Azoarcus sp.]|jgi:hypothetical protein|nr:FixH family protein [Azoarcus sp.]
MQAEMQAMSRRLLSIVLVCCVFWGEARAALPQIVAKLDGPVSATVNQFYELPLKVSDANGVGLPGLNLQIRGRMPEHSHGLPTTPRISEKGEGRYLIEGVSFSMPGRWVIEILLDNKLLLRQELTVKF